MFKKIIIATTAAAGLMGAVTASAADVLRVGTEPTFAPFEFLDTKTNEYTGYDMDLIRAVAAKAGYEVKIVNMGFDALIPALSTGAIDVIAAGISITPERQKRVDFTDPYYKSGLSYLIRKDEGNEIKSFADLKGKNIAVQIGNTGAEYAKHQIPDTTVVAFNTTNEAFMNLNNRASDAVVLDRPVLAYFLKARPAMAKRLILSDEVADAEYFAFAVEKGNKALLEKLNKALAEVKASGEFEKIEQKWFAK